MVRHVKASAQGSINSRCLLCLLLGVNVGYLLHGTRSRNALQQQQDLEVLSNHGKRGSKNAFWDIQPFEQSLPTEYLPGRKTDVYNPFYHYLKVFGREAPHAPHFPELPLLHTWIHFPEAYHNHLNRFRKREKVVFMEVGVQSGGKIAMLRDYFGPGFTYIGIDINPSCKMFEADWAHIEIGDSGDPHFWQQIKAKYPVVDIFLDDGGHTMNQQKTALEHMLPHIQPDGVYICEDLSTSWGSETFGGIPNQDHRNEEFRNTTMVGLVHKTLDWLVYGWIPGAVMSYEQVAPDFFQEPWWRVIPEQVKHIHYYNQIVVYEKGITYVPQNVKTVGMSIPYQESGTHKPVDWDLIMKTIQRHTGSKWVW